MQLVKQVRGSEQRGPEREKGVGGLLAYWFRELCSARLLQEAWGLRWHRPPPWASLVGRTFV